MLVAAWGLVLCNLVWVPSARSQDFAPATPVWESGPSKDLDCIAQAIVYEAGHEPLEGQQAVAQVILNRMQAAQYPKTACGVVYQGSNRRTGCQFTFTCDGSRARRLPEKLFFAARAVAMSALNGTLPDRVGGATHYHANYVSPYWASSLIKVSQIGAHIFYRSGGERRQSPRPGCAGAVGGGRSQCVRSGQGDSGSSILALGALATVMLQPSAVSNFACKVKRSQCDVIK